jgi:hypothetical protein
MQELKQKLCKMVKKMDKGGKWTWQGGQGPTCHSGQPHHGTARCPHLPIPCHRSMGEVIEAFSSIDLKSVCTDGHNGVVLDPWILCHGLGALQPTLELPYRPNLRMCYLHNRLWEPTKALRSKCYVPKLPPPPYLTSISTTLQ